MYISESQKVFIMPLQKIDFFIVEDEKSALQALSHALAAYEDVSIVGHAGSVEDAYKGILECEPDALFLDIKLQGGDAFHLMHKFQKNSLSCPPAIVMTGHDEFEIAQKAINQFRDKILKILKKPFWNDFDVQFEQCRDAIFAYQQAAQRSRDPEVFFIKDGPVTYRMEYNEIDYVEVGGSGSIFLGTSASLEECKKVNQTLIGFLEHAPERFVRIHRNYAIQLSRISHLNHEEHMVYLRGYNRGLPVGRTYYPALKQLLDSNN